MMKIGLRKNIFIVFVLMFTVVQAGMAAKTLIIVPSKAGFGVQDKSGLAELFTSASASEVIQFAIDQLSEGGEVVLPRGCFNIEEPLVLKDGVILSGQGRGTELRRVGDARVVLYIDGAVESVVRHLAVTSTDKQELASGIALSSSNGCVIEDVLVVGFKKYGIHVDGGKASRIQSCFVVGNDLANIQIENTVQSEVPCLINNTIFLWGGSGVRCVNAKSVAIESCIVQQIFGEPLDLDGEDISIRKTRTFYAESPDASVIVRGSNFEIANNIFCWGRGNGIVVDGANDVLIKENNIIDCGTPPGDEIFKSGLLLCNEANNVTVTSNAIWNWDDWTQGPMRYGIEELAGCWDNLFTYNAIQFYNKDGIFSAGKDTVVRDNASDPGKDDLKLLPDFDVWREYIQKFIDEDLLNGDGKEWIGEDMEVVLESGFTKIRSMLSGEELFYSKDSAKAIQWAIDETAPRGGSIELGQGVFNINSAVILKKNVWLRGQGAQTVLRAARPVNACVRVAYAPQSRLTDMRLIQGGGVSAGVEIFSSVTSKVENVIIEGFEKFGVDFAVEEGMPDITWGGKAVSSLVIVEGCSMANNGLTHVNIPHHGGYIGNAVPMLITDNVMMGGRVGIDCWAICANLIDNIICNTSGVGIVQNGNSILNTGNTLYRCGGSAVLAFDGLQFHAHHPTYDRQDNNNNKECNISGNVIIDSQGHGIEVSEQWGVIAGNIIVNSGLGNGQRYGIWLHEDSESYAVVNNEIFNIPSEYPMIYGIRENGFNNILAENNISNVRREGIWIQGLKTTNKLNQINREKQVIKPSAWALDTALVPSMTRDAVKVYIDNVLKKYRLESINAP